MSAEPFPHTHVSDALVITAGMHGRAFSRSDVRAWEHRRARKVARRLGIPAEANELTRRITDRKLELGHDAIRALMRRDLRISSPVGHLGALLSAGRRSVATTVLAGDDGAAELIPAWYRERFADGDERSLLAACPDHWLSHQHPDGRQEVLETTGGAPSAAQMFFDDRDTTAVRTAPDPSFPVEWVSVARDAGGHAIGGIRHRFRDEHPGFTVELNVEFPATVPQFMVRQHCWHLACEFSNWIDLANRR